MTEERDINHPGKTGDEEENPIQVPGETNSGDAESEATGSGPSGGAPRDNSPDTPSTGVEGSGPSGGAPK